MTRERKTVRCRHGAQAFVEVAEVRPGLRGLVASTDIDVDKVVVVLPHNLAIPLATSAAPAPVRWANTAGANLNLIVQETSGQSAAQLAREECLTSPADKQRTPTHKDLPSNHRALCRTVQWSWCGAGRTTTLPPTGTFCPNGC